MKLYFASNNNHKKSEMERLLKGNEIILPKELGLEFDPEETGSTFLENALIKAKTLYSLVKAPVLADDSGLIVEALPSLLGVKTARFGYDVFGHISSREQYTYLLKLLEGEENRKAHFVCSLVLYLGDDQFYVIQEKVDGSIAQTASGIDGFGYDPVFLVENTGKTAAELKPEEKDLYSHRGKACRKLLYLINED